MSGLDVEDSMIANGTVHSRVFGVVLRFHLRELQSSLQQRIVKVFSLEILAGTRHADGWTEIQSFSMAKRLITAAKSLVFFGQDLTDHSKFLAAALEYPDNLLTTAEILRLVPSALAPFLAPSLMGEYRVTKILINRLMPTIEARLRLREQGGENLRTRPLDCNQFFIDANTQKDPWSTQKTVQVLLGIWFAPVHQPALSLVYALDDLCKHPEYINPFKKRAPRKELSWLRFEQSTPVG